MSPTTFSPPAPLTSLPSDPLPLTSPPGPSFALETSPSTPFPSLPQNSYLVHATNALATWGAGVAAQIRKDFPSAYAEYVEYCNSVKRPMRKWPGRERCGGCLVAQAEGSGDASGAGEGIRVVCLFTSHGYGRPASTSDASRGGRGGRILRGGMAPKGPGKKPGRDPVPVILSQTTTSLQEFRRCLEQEHGQAPATKEEENKSDGMKEGEGEWEDILVFSPRFNAGLFRVPWPESERRIRDAFDGFGDEVRGKRGRRLRCRWFVLGEP